jgi:hypothetical protein
MSTMSSDHIYCLSVLLPRFRWTVWRDVHAMSRVILDCPCSLLFAYNCALLCDF